MTEIEKMYENAGVESACCKYAEYGYEGEEGTWFYCTKENKECWTYPNGDADCVEKGYPPFTAEKQIELIKWLIQKNFYDERIIKSNFEKTYFYCTYDDYCESEYFEKFEEALANVFNYFWQDLTDKEKEEIRRILNDN